MLTLVPALRVLALASLLGQDPQQVSGLRALAARPATDAVTAHVTRYPDDAPEAVRGLLLQVALAEAPSSGPLDAADRIARAVAEVWHDSSLVRRVATFRDRAPRERRAWAAADSLLQAGRAALYRDGAVAAISIWRAASVQFATLGDTAGVAAALGNVGAAFYSVDELDSAAVYLERARRLARAARAPRIAANATVTLGVVAAERGDLARAQELYAGALVLHQQVGDQRGAAADRHNLGEIAETLGDWALARREYQAALDLNRTHGHRDAAAANLEGLGNVAVLEADPAEAAERYAEALAIYRERDEPLNAAHVLFNLGLLATRRGDYRRAAAHLAESVAAYERGGAPDDLVEARRALAVAHAAMGDLDESLSDLDAAERMAAGAELGPDVRGSLALARADLTAQFNQRAEAEQGYRAAAAWFEQAGNTLGRAEAQQGLAILLLAQDEPSEARDLLDLALRSQETEGATRGAAWTRVVRADAQRALGDAAGARTALREAALTFRRLGDAVSQAAALAELGDLEREAGMTRTAEAAYREGLTVLAARPAPAVAWQLHAGLGAALAVRHADAEAAEALRAAIAAVEGVASDLGQPERRTAFLADKWEAYGRLAYVEYRRGRAAAAFEASERMRARQMLEMVARGRLSLPDQAIQTLADREEDVRRRVAELTGGLVRPAGTRDLPATDDDATREVLERLRGEHADLLRDLDRRAPGLGALVTASPARASDVVGRVASDQAIVEYLVGDSTTIAFVVTADTVAAVDLNVGRRALAQQIAFVRGTFAAHDAAAAREAWRAPLRRLHGYLVAPLERGGLLDGARRLVLVPHAELHYLPFEALLAGNRFLLDAYDVAYAPSASVWLQLADRRTAVAEGTVLALAPRTDALPGSRRELEAIGRLYGAQARIVAGTGATERLVRESAGVYETLHLATFGVLNRHNPLFSYVALGPSGSDDGRLEVREVFGLDLRARVVVLSACETGAGAGPLGDVPAGDEWVSLMRAFLQAGAANVVATLWPVADAETASLVGAFFAHLRTGADPSAALANAKRLVAANSRTAHPFYWAGFVIGGGT